MPQRLTKNLGYRGMIEDFILDWFDKTLGLDQGKIATLRNHSQKRAIFFRSSCGFFEQVINVIMKSPDLLKKAFNHIFRKEESRLQEEAKKYKSARAT